MKIEELKITVDAETARILLLGIEELDNTLTHENYKDMSEKEFKSFECKVKAIWKTLNTVDNLLTEEDEQ